MFNPRVPVSSLKGKNYSLSSQGVLSFCLPFLLMWREEKEGFALFHTEVFSFPSYIPPGRRSPPEIFYGAIMLAPLGRMRGKFIGRGGILRNMVLS